MCLKTKFRKAMLSLFNNSVVTDSTISMNINIREFNEKIEDIDPEIKSYLNNSISEREKRYKGSRHWIRACWFNLCRGACKVWV